MSTETLPPPGTSEREWWQAGARAEARCREEQIPEHLHHVVRCVAVSAEVTANLTELGLVRRVVFVFVPGSRWARAWWCVRMAYRMLRSWP